MEKKTTIAAVVVVIIVIVAVVAAYYVMDDSDDDTPVDEGGSDEGGSDEGGSDADTTTYYIYLDGFDADGWYTIETSDISDAVTAAFTQANLTVTISSSGWLTVDGFDTPYSYDQDTGDYTGKGISVYLYVSTDTSSPYSGYFVTGDVVTSSVSNIIYIAYGDYVMDGTTWETTYTVNPSDSTAWMTGGPFAVDSDYEAPTYNTYYIYLDGFDADGWYTIETSDISDAVTAAFTQANLTVTISSSGWLTVDGFDTPYSYDQDTGDYTGKGISVYLYVSTDTSSPYSGYFVTGDVVISSVSNIIYIAYGDYVMDGTTWETTYTVNPSDSTDWMITGPFAA